LIECHGGGTGTSANGDSAFAQRDAKYLVAIMPMWTDASEDEAQIGWARSTWDAMQPYSSGGTLLSYISAGEDDAIKAAFGSSYPKLQALKRQYDPANFFSQNQNIQPAA
jgi:FAD/FMN-containing dehydrogenase